MPHDSSKTTGQWPLKFLASWSTRLLDPNKMQNCKILILFKILSNGTGNKYKFRATGFQLSPETVRNVVKRYRQQSQCKITVLTKKVATFYNKQSRVL